MDPTLRFRQLLAAHLVHIAGAAAIAAPAAGLASCGGNVVVDPEGTGAGGAGGAPPTTVASGDPTTSVTTTSVGTATGTGTSSTTTSTSTGEMPVYDCFPWLVDTLCPVTADAGAYFSTLVDCMGTNGTWTQQVLEGPYEEAGQCCYWVVQGPCRVGRPFLVDGRPQAATAAARAGTEQARDDGWSASGLAPHLQDLGAAEREVLAAEWARDGLLEHASVAAFARFSLELLLAGAPADLVEATHRAALDEVRHAQLCLGLAGAYRGAPITPGPLPCGDGLRIGADLPALAAAAAREGCVGETIAAILAAEQLARATDPAVRRVLAQIAADEATHAALSFRAVAWALRAGGEPAREAVAAVFEEAAREGVAAGGVAADPRGILAAHDRLHVEATRAAAARALAEVVLPSGRALLGALHP